MKDKYLSPSWRPPLHSWTVWCTAGSAEGWEVSSSPRPHDLKRKRQRAEEAEGESVPAFTWDKATPATTRQGWVDGGMLCNGPNTTSPNCTSYYANMCTTTSADNPLERSHQRAIPDSPLGGVFLVMIFSHDCNWDRLSWLGCISWGDAFEDADESIKK